MTTTYDSFWVHYNLNTGEVRRTIRQRGLINTHPEFHILFAGKGIANIAGKGIVSSIANESAPRVGLTNAQLVQNAATKAEAAIGGTGPVAGTAKHTYAKNLLIRYQSIYGDRGLSLGSNYFKGKVGKGYLDVVNHNTKVIYDFKFGNAVMSNAQYLKYSNSFPGYSIQIIKP